MSAVFPCGGRGGRCRVRPRNDSFGRRGLSGALGGRCRLSPWGVRGGRCGRGSHTRYQHPPPNTRAMPPLTETMMQQWRHQSHEPRRQLAPQTHVDEPCFLPFYLYEAVDRKIYACILYIYIYIYIYIYHICLCIFFMYWYVYKYILYLCVYI